jgi:hypothetical protein
MPHSGQKLDLKWSKQFDPSRYCADDYKDGRRQEGRPRAGSNRWPNETGGAA